MASIADPNQTSYFSSWLWPTMFAMDFCPKLKGRYCNSSIIETLSQMGKDINQ